MSGSSDRALLRRLVDFERALERDSSETVEEFGWGRLIHNPETAAMWTDNYLEVHSTGLDADDWPWKLYERLGFDRVGEFCAFLRKPAQLREAASP